MKPVKKKKSSYDPFKEVIEYAIEQEVAEALFYERLAKRTSNTELRAMLLTHAQEEEIHRRKLEEILHTHKLPTLNEHSSGPDLKIGGILVPGKRKTKELSYQDILILAIKMEQANQNLYEDFAVATLDPEAKRLFLFLADQEAKHRAVLEREYDENILRED